MSQSHSLQDALLKKQLDFVKKSQERMENLVANALKRQQNGGGPMAGKTRATKQGHSPSLIKTPVTTKGAPGIGGKYVAKKDQRSKSEVQSHSNSNVGVSKGEFVLSSYLPKALRLSFFKSMFMRNIVPQQPNFDSLIVNNSSLHCSYHDEQKYYR